MDDGIWKNGNVVGKTEEEEENETTDSTTVGIKDDDDDDFATGGKDKYVILPEVADKYSSDSVSKSIDGVLTHCILPIK